MGIPKFFRYMSERYPCLSELVREDQIPDFDHLYLDMNGIIHPCSHPDDGNVHFRITEETIFRAVFDYVDKLFFLIKPRKLFFMAVDGVAPRAKMNQQRSRRFRSAKEAETLEKNALTRGEKLPETARFDSNCITPGTEFMVRLQAALKYFVKLKMSTNPLWQRCRIILSGHETPGEGEHKIMEYIRYLKSQPGYDANTRHCLYGLDADLIVLGLCTHEMHFSLLREEVNFGKKAKKVSIEEIRFYLLHLNLLREYLELEFGCLKDIENKDFNIHKIIDDWILMGFLVGNDFIPHLPNFHINTNALPLFYKIYKAVWPQMEGYLNNNGCLNLSNFELFMEKVAEIDAELFRDLSSDLKYMEGKRGNNNEPDIPEAFNFDAKDSSHTMSFDLAKMIEESNKMYGGDDEDFSDEEAMLEKEFSSHKRDYYITKLGYPEMTPEVLAEQTECYVRALQWILFYYYKGVSSWGWFYPHHYAPYASDIKNFKHLQLDYDMGKPFLPFEQLLAVLPAASKELLPEAYRDLMTNPSSEIIEYYPEDFKTDLNGKKQDWEAVVLIPFIDEERLLDAMSKRFPSLLIDEKNRNIHGPMLQYDYNETAQEGCPGVFSFKNIDKVYCIETTVWRDEIKVPPNYLDMENSRPAQKRRYLPGFPTLKYLNYTGELQRARVKVFEQPSRNETMILFPEIKEFGELEELAKEFLNKIVYVGWPHLVKSKVFAIFVPGLRATSDGVVEVHQKLFDSQLSKIEEHTTNRMGIKFRETTVLVLVNTLVSIEHVVGAELKMVATPIWSNTEVAYPLQGVVMDISTEEDLPESKIEEFFPVGTPVFMLSSPYFGCEGKILDPSLVYSCGRIQVNITVIPEPQLVEAKKLHAEAEQRYYNSYELSSKSGLNSGVIARITGSVLIVHGSFRTDLPDNTPKTNIGLNLKSKKTDQQVARYVRKQGTTWQYSQKTFELLMDYYCKFPEVFNLLSSNTGGNDEFFETTLYPPQETDKKLSDIRAWLKEQSHNDADRVPCGTKWVESEAIDAIKKAVEDLKVQPVKCIKLQVKPHLLLKHGLEIPQGFRSKSMIRLFDRIVVVRKTYQVPIGYKGTVVAIHPMSDSNPVRIECVRKVETFIEVLFDKELPDIGEDAEGELKRVARVAQNSVLVVYQPLDEKVMVSVQNPSVRQQNANITYENNGVGQDNTNKSTQSGNKRDMAFFIEPPKNKTYDPLINNFNRNNERRAPDQRNNQQTMNISSILQRQPPSVGMPGTAPVPINRVEAERSAAITQFPNMSSFNMPRTNTGNYLARAWSPVEDNNSMNRNGGQSNNQHRYAPQLRQFNPQAPQSMNPRGVFGSGSNNHDSVGGINKGMGDMNLHQVTEVTKSTEVLRKLLGMATTDSDTSTTGRNAAKNNIESGRNPSTSIQPAQKSSINFPKPPSNWTNDATQKTNRRRDVNPFPQPCQHQMPFNNMFVPRFAPSNYVQPIQPQHSQFYTNTPQHIDKIYPSAPMPDHYHKKNDSQMCPSHETRVTNISSGPSAFIPLQALRSSRKSGQQKSSSAKPTEQASETADTKSREEVSKPSPQDQVVELEPSPIVVEPKAKPVQPRIRKPKIAANFNLNG